MARAPSLPYAQSPDISARLKENISTRGFNFIIIVVSRTDWAWWWWADLKQLWLPSNQPNTFSVLNVKISIDQQQRNPEYSLDHSKKKKTARIIIQLWRRNRTSPNTDLTRACAVTGLGVMKCFLLPPKLLHAIPSLDGVDVNCSSDYTTMPPWQPSYISWQVDPSLRASLLMVKISAKVVDPFWRKNLAIFVLRRKYRLPGTLTIKVVRLIKL